MDVVILAGGLGTRLRGVWDGPKCLVPIAGKPVLDLLLELVWPIKGTDNITLCLGYKYWDVLQHLGRGHGELRCSAVINEKHIGTCGAFRETIGGIRPPVLVLNGDTLPLYNLWELVQVFVTSHYHCASAWSNGSYAGQMILGSAMLERISKSTAFDFEPSLFHDAVRYEAPGFFDIGSAEAFTKATKYEWRQS